MNLNGNYFSSRLKLAASLLGGRIALAITGDHLLSVSDRV
jgi:hypothetical protein